MEYKETRIGNLVEYEGKVYRLHIIAEEIPHLDSDEFGTGVVGWENLKSIPLTKDWMVKFGFYLAFQSKGNENTDRGIWRRSWISIAVAENGWYAHNDCGSISKTYNYVHELQNLYFALTGEELKPEE